MKNSALRKNKLPTPRPYLSWSQLQLFESSPQAWVRRYIYGEKFTNPAMEFGREIAEGLEKDETDNPAVEHMRTFLPAYPEKEYEIKVKWKGVPLLGKLDQADPKNLTFNEIKTGTVAWTQRRVDTHGQITFYWLLFWQKHGWPEKAGLSWAPTALNEDGNPMITGMIKTFTTIRTLGDISAMSVRIQKAWDGIQKVTKKEYAKIS